VHLHGVVSDSGKTKLECEWSFEKTFQARVLPRQGETLTINGGDFEVTSVNHDLTEDEGIIIYCDDCKISQVDFIFSENGGAPGWSETGPAIFREKFRELFARESSTSDDFEAVFGK